MSAMRIHIVATICAALAGLSFVSAPALAQQKTERQCSDEWRANRAANQAAQITERDYVAKCRAGTTAAQPPAAPPAAAAAPPAKSQSPAAAATPKAAPTPKSAPTTTGIAAGEFKTEALAKASCPTDIVVWANLDSKIYHFSGNKSFGNTKEGAYMCEKVALGQGIRAAKNEKHP
jgi:hypothetical protein